jgi:hypothetical protein
MKIKGDYLRKEGDQLEREGWQVRVMEEEYD